MGEAVSQNLVGLLDNDKGGGVNIHNQLLELCQLALADHRQHHLYVLVGIGPGSVEVGSPPVQLVGNGLRDFFMLLGDDQRHPGVVEAMT